MIELKKGEKCIIKGFTGIKLGVFEVAAASKKTVTVIKKNGDEMIFDRKTGKQVNVEEGKERFANSIMEDDGSYVAPNRQAKKKEPEKKAPKKTTKKALKKKPEPELEEDEEDDDFEDDDDDFEEVDD